MDMVNLSGTTATIRFEREELTTIQRSLEDCQEPSRAGHAYALGGAFQAILMALHQSEEDCDWEQVKRSNDAQWRRECHLVDQEDVS